MQILTLQARLLRFDCLLPAQALKLLVTAALSWIVREGRLRLLMMRGASRSTRSRW